MSIDWSFRDYFNLSKKIPLHYQKKYLANISNGSFNVSMLTGVYKNKIKKLIENNKALALALQNDKAQREELLAESKANADLILFSRLKLTTMSENVKKVVSVLDEALSLLEMHSSSSISKFVPKSTVNHEEFKEQLKEVSMAAIPEEIEPPEETPTKRSKIEDDVLKEIKGDSYCKRKASQQNLSNIEQKINGNKFIKDNLKQMKIPDEKISPVKNMCVKTKKKKILSNRKRTQKPTTQDSDSSNKELLIEDLKKTDISKFDLNEAKVISENNSKMLTPFGNLMEKTVPAKKDSLSLNSSNLLNVHQDKKEQENSSKSYKSNKNITFKLCVTDNLSIEKSLLNESPTNNLNKDQLFESAKENPVNKDFKMPSVKKTALKNISSKINIENLELEKTKNKSICPLDVLTLVGRNEKDFITRKSICSVDEKENKKRKSIYTSKDLFYPVKHGKEIVKKRKSNNLVLKNVKKSISRKKLLNENVSSISDKDKESTDFILQSNTALHEQEEMVKNLAKSTFLVTAEVHKIQPINSEIHPKTEKLQPVVLLTDIFKSSKSLFKSISPLSCNQANEISLEKQLLQHCSSLKIITEDPFNTYNNNSVHTDSGVGKSVDHNKDENSPKTISYMEPPLIVDGEINEKKMNEDKKALRKKRSMICYREVPLNVKMRRGEF